MELAIFSDMAAKVLADDGSDDRAAAWARVEAAGLDRLLLPEAQGGAGDAFDEAVAVMVEFGKAAGAVPLAETMLANWCLARAGMAVSDGPKAFLVGPDAGTLHAVGARVEGGAEAVWAPVVTSIVAVLPTVDGVVVAQWPSNAGRTIASTLAGEPVARFDAATDVRLGRGPFVDMQLPLALALSCTAAGMVGVCEAALSMSVEYANTRKQFGRQIAGFQAVQHLAARIATETAAATAALRGAVNGLAGDNPLWGAAVAKARVSEAAGMVAAAAHQVHGAIGFTEECRLQRLTRRLWAWRDRYGGEEWWYRRIGEAAAGVAGEGLWPHIVSGLRLDDRRPARKFTNQGVWNG